MVPNRLNMTRRLVPGVTFLGHILKLTYLDSRSLCTMLFVVTSGDLNVDLTQNKFLKKVVGLPANYPTPFAAFRFYR